MHCAYGRSLPEVADDAERERRGAADGDHRAEGPHLAPPGDVVTALICRPSVKDTHTQVRPTA
jgi:hypothetical protein